jgi:hypothetical protein
VVTFGVQWISPTFSQIRLAQAEVRGKGLEVSLNSTDVSYYDVYTLRVLVFNTSGGQKIRFPILSPPNNIT